MAAPILSSDSLPIQAQGSEQQRLEVSLLRQSAPEDTLLSLFERASLKFPRRTAVVCGQEEITYNELDRRSNQLSRKLQEFSVAPGAIAAIYLDRSIEMLAAMLGVLKSGAAYLPIDPGYPQSRVAQTLDDARPTVLITSSRLAAELPAVEAKIFLIDKDAFNTLEDGLDRTYLPKADDLAYLMYTSGSTGRPKGVLVSHKNVVRLMTQTDNWFRFNETDVWTMFHSFAFDFSVWEIWGPLTTGGKLVVVPFSVSRSPEDFYILLSDQKVTILNQTPSAFSLLSQVEETRPLPLSLRTVIFGGEALQYRSLKNWFRRHGDSKPQLVNMYGITETTVHVTYRVVRESDTSGEPDSLIGVPIPDLRIHLLDSNLLPVKDGEVGEICVGGAGVAKGYLNRAELTAERFISNSFGDAGMKLYRSGDLARRRGDGELVYLGRGDNQVKINGFRIELGEVEAAIGDFPGVHGVCVIAHTGEDGMQRLAAYFVMAGSGTPTPGEMSSFLSQRLPAQMMPAFYTQLEAIPLTGNGKVDRVALPKPSTGSRQVTGGATAGTPMQERLAQIWRTVLGAETVGLDDNFFDIGGTSVLLVAVRSALQQSLVLSIPVTWMFEFTTIRSLADKLSEESSAPPKTTTPAASPLTAAQEQAKRQREAFARLKAAKGTAR